MTPSEILAEIYDYLKESAKSSETPLKSLVISFLVYAAKEFLKESIFICPIQHHRVCGSLFIYGPAVVLFCISLLVSESFWKFTTGVGFILGINWSKSRKSIYLSILPPVIWMILVFADAHYYICAKIGPVKTLKASANGTAAMAALELRISNAHTDSQIIAWALLISLVLLATIALTIERCLSRHKSKILGQAEFKDLEAEIAVEIFNTKVKPLAENQAKQVITDLFDLYENEKPDDLIKLGKEYLTGIYPDYGTLGGRHLCMAGMRKNKRGGKVRKGEEAEVGLTESGPQKLYTSIN